jgi:hypothetical protein
LCAFGIGIKEERVVDEVVEESMGSKKVYSLWFGSFW